MPLRKTAIAVPQDVLEEVDRAASERGESRNRFINRILRAALNARRDAAITRRLDALFADERIAKEQTQVAEQLDAAGTDWHDERW